MSWIGKLVGGTIGFALAGPLGGVAGAVFGHAFDKGEDRRLGAPVAGLSPEEQAQMTFFVATFSMLAKLAATDGHISKEETRAIEQFMDQDLALTPENKEIAFRLFSEAANANTPFEAFAQQFYQQFQSQPEMLDVLLNILFRVAMADGVLSPGEDVLLRATVNIFRLPETVYQQFKTRYATGHTGNGPNRGITGMAAYYAILKCAPEDSDETIKKQYRQLAVQYHPDKIASKGLPEEFTTFATEKFQEIQEAYEAIKKERNM